MSKQKRTLCTMQLDTYIEVPDEILVNILSFADIRTILAASVIHPSWQDVVAENTFWKMLLHRDFISKSGNPRKMYIQLALRTFHKPKQTAVLSFSNEYKTVVNNGKTANTLFLKDRIPLDANSKSSYYFNGIKNSYMIGFKLVQKNETIPPKKQPTYCDADGSILISEEESILQIEVQDKKFKVKYKCGKNGVIDKESTIEDTSMLIVPCVYVVQGGQVEILNKTMLITEQAPKKQVEKHSWVFGREEPKRK